MDAEAASEGLVVLPFRLQVPNLYLGGLSVQWQGGEWRQGSLEGAVSIEGSTIHVSRAVAQEARLLLAETPASPGPVELPEINLPLELQVDGLLLQQVGWDVYGWQDSLSSLQLQGNWRNTRLRLDSLQLRSAELGAAIAAGSLEFSGQWPLELGVDAFPAAWPQWPQVVERHLRLDASGNLASLAVQLQVGGAVSTSAQVQLDTLAPDMPFQLAAQLDWPDELELASIVALPAALADVTLVAPLDLTVTGSLAEQHYQLSTAGTFPPYPQLSLNLGGSHRAGLLTVEDMRLADAASSNTLWGSGELRYAERLEWSLALESGGLALPPVSAAIDGQLAGQLQLDGWLAGDDWEATLSGVSLQGEVNGLPASITGYGGAGSDLALLPSDFKARLNGARLLLHKPRQTGGGARVELSVDDLGLWLPGSRGSLQLRAIPDEDWSHIGLEGSLQALAWEQISVHAGRLEGDYYPGQRQSRLQLVLEGIGMGPLDLEQLSFDGRGNSSQQAFRLAARGDIDGSLAVAGDLDEQGRWAGQLEATSLQTPEGTWHLTEPVQLAADPDPWRLQVAGHCWYYQQSRICPGEALLGETGAASLAIYSGFDALSAFLPEYLEVSGALDATVAVNWAPGAALDLQGSLQGRDLQVTRHFGAGESGSAHWQSLDAVIGRGPAGLELRANLFAQQQRRVSLALQLPARREDALSGEVLLEGLQLGNLAPFFPDLSSLEGELRGALEIGGTLAGPLANGSVQLSEGRLALLGNPTQLEGLELTLAAAGDSLSVRGGGLLGGGPLDISGELFSRPEWRLQLRVSGERQELLIPPYTQMQISEELQLAMTGAELDITGRVIVHKGVLEHEQLPEGSVGLSGDVVEVDLDGSVLNESSSFLTRIDIALLLEDKFKIVGDMVNATLGGDLQLLQVPGKPLQLFGNLNVIGGELRAYQQRLRIQRGTVSFSGPPENPELDVSAQREIPADKVVVGISLQGSLERPQLQVFSTPTMSQADTMSYLIRGRPVDTGAEADGIATALSLGTGLVNETSLVTQLNEIPGISNLAFGAEGSAEDTAATVGGYIGERLYLSYGMGIYEPINVLTARLYLQTRLWLEVVSRLENSVDLYYSFDIK
jgi:autotransporter translocation and assembly factor TamB